MRDPLRHERKNESDPGMAEKEMFCMNSIVKGLYIPQTETMQTIQLSSRSATKIRAGSFRINKSKTKIIQTQKIFLGFEL